MSREFATIARVLEHLGAPGAAAGVALGAGDDAALLLGGAWPLVCVDAMVQGRHWDPAFSAPEDVGYKLLASNLSDIAAMGGEPGPFLLALALPAPFDDAFVDGLASGLIAACRDHGLDPEQVALIGGDTTATDGPVVLALTLLGRPLRPGRLLTRAAARPGDQLWVSGALGGAAAGLALLQAGEGEADWAAELVRRHRRPRARVDLVATLVDEPDVHAAIDVSDGLAGDLGHILTRSGVGAELRRTALPIDAAVERAATELGVDSLAWVLHGGEDYELLVSAAPSAAATLTRSGCALVGRVVAREERAGIALVEADGRVRELAARGYEHG